MTSAAERTTYTVHSPKGGWLHPWPNVAELAQALTPGSWTLIGGLMTQLHAHHRGLDAVRPTHDVDIVLHIETARGVPSATAEALESLGYRMTTSLDPFSTTGHRFLRDSDRRDAVDVVVADHPAPRIVERMRRRDMVQVPGGTQALRRTALYRVEIEKDSATTISVPRPFGALVLKAAAYVADPRDRDRHLFDATVLLACIEDPIVEREQFAGSDRARLLVLQRELGDGHQAWRAMPATDAARGRAVPRALCA